MVVIIAIAAISYVQRYPAQLPELKAQWEAANRARETEAHRAQLLAVLNAPPGMPIKTIRSLPQNGFSG